MDTGGLIRLPEKAPLLSFFMEMLMRLQILRINKMLLVLISGLLLSSFSTSAQSKSSQTDSLQKKTESNKKEKRDALRNFSDELTEAVKFLDETKGDLSKLQVYKLADTEKSAVAPLITGAILTSGKEFDRLEQAAVNVASYHKLEKHLSVLLFDNPSPMVFTYKLRTVYFSTGILEKLEGDEIAALIGHEIGHLYFAKELLLARETGDDRLARTIELKCDIVSLVTLRGLKLDQTALISALKKLIASRKEKELTTTSEQSPLPTDREKLAEIFYQRNLP